MKKNKYEPGDVLLITAWNNCDDIWQTGIIQIIDYDPCSAHTEYGIYSTKRLTGEITWICHNAQMLDDMTEVRLLGNINVDKGWKVLYAGKQYLKQRT